MALATQLGHKRIYACRGTWRVLIFMEVGDNVPFVWPPKLPSPKLDKVLGTGSFYKSIDHGRVWEKRVYRNLETGSGDQSGS